eukprot:6467958-Amphidinium_carterae.1
MRRDVTTTWLENPKIPTPANASYEVLSLVLAHTTISTIDYLCREGPHVCALHQTDANKWQQRQV